MWNKPAIRSGLAERRVQLRFAFRECHRVVWRCNALNAASMRATRRFGSTYEGTWRGDVIVKGRRRDTAWFSIVEPEWPTRRALFEAWLDDSNFDADGIDLKPLSPNI